MLKRKWNQESLSKKTVSKKQVRLRSSIFFFSLLGLFSCTNEGDITTELLSDVLSFYNTSELDEVIACAASKKEESSTTFIYYYPLPEYTNVQYYETENATVDPNNFSNYHQKELNSEQVFGGYLERFVRSGSDEVFCIVTFQTEGKFHKSNPIRLKQNSKATEYSDELTIDTLESLMPVFSWNDGVFPENAIYFQVISDENNGFISGTYTLDTWFQYYKLSNVVLDINRETPPELMLNQQYNFSMLAVSLDNWVNLVIEKPFVAQ